MTPPRKYLVYSPNAIALAVLFAIGGTSTAIYANSLRDRSLWFDEAFSWALAKRFATSEIIARTASDVHPPLYYLLLHVWIELWGDSPAALRMMSVSWALVALGGVFVLCRDVMCQQSRAPADLQHKYYASAVSVALLASSAYFVQWSHEARMYTMAMALTLLAGWFLLRALDRPAQARSWWFGYIIASLSLLYTHNYGIFSVAGGFGFSLFYLAMRARWRVRSMRGDDGMRAACASIAIVIAGYSPWIPVLLRQQRRVNHDYWISSLEWSTIPDIWFFLFFPDNDCRPDYAAGPIGLAITSVGVLICFVWRQDWRRCMIASFVVAPVIACVAISVLLVPIAAPQYLLLSFAFVPCVFAIVIFDALDAVGSLALSGALVMCGLVGCIQHERELDVERRRGVRAAISELQSLRKERDAVLVLHPCILFSAQYYLSGLHEPKVYLPEGETRHYLGQPVMTRDDIATREQVERWDCQRIWVVDTSGYSALTSRFELPSSWRPKPGSRRSFPEVYCFQGSVFVTLYERQ